MEIFDKAFEGIDTFFDVYDRWVPAGTSEVLILIVVVGLCAAVLL